MELSPLNPSVLARPPRLHRLRGGIGCLLAAVAFTGCGDVLVSGTPIDAELSGREQRVFHVAVRHGEAARVHVEQYQTDLVLTVTPPGGAAHAIDMRERGLESATLIADGPGSFQVAVAARSELPAPIRYSVRLETPPHPIADRDRRMAAAERLETDGKRLATAAVPSLNEASRALTAALEIWRGLNDVIGTATTLARIGDVLRATNRFREAEAAYIEALALFRTLGHTYQIALTENNLGAALYNRGALDEARAHYRTALELWASLPGSDVDTAATLSNEAAMFVEYGDYQAALDRLRVALPVLERHPRLGPPVLNLLGVANRAVGDLDAAELYFTRTRGTLPPSDPRVARLGLRLAQIALSRGEVQVADAGARDALAAIRRTKNPLAEAEALDQLGEVDVAAGRFDDAVANHEQALALYRQADARRGVSTALHHLGVASRMLGRIDGARDALTRALAMRRDIGLRDAEAETRYELGVLEGEAGTLPLAQSHLDAAIALIEDVRGRVSGEYSRAVYFASRQKYFASLIDVLMRFHAARPGGGYAVAAFEAAERERARSLIDLLRDSGTATRRGASPDLLEQQRDEQRQLDFWASRVARLSNQAGTKAADEVAFAFERMNHHLTEYRALDARIRGVAARQLSVISPPVFTLRQIQRRLLNPGTRLLRVSLGQRRSHAWLVSPDSMVVATLPPKAEIDRLAGRVIELMRTGRTARTADDLHDQWRRDARALSTAVLGPLAGELGDHRLLIVCDGLLQLVPFAALPEPGRDAALIVGHEVAMLPSASAVMVSREQIAGRAPAPGAVAVVADAVYEGDDPRLTHLRPLPAEPPDGGLVGESFPVARLMLARTEGEWVLRFAGPEQRFAAFGFDASHDAVARLGGYRVVHLALHAITDGVRPELSAVILSQYDEQGRRRRGGLRLNEITTGLSLRADVVVLSACSSVDGRDFPGEGLMGLAWGFFGAGAASVIGSLSNVREEPTLELMKTLYEELLGPRRLRPAAALRAAQLKMMVSRRFSDPFYWASFVFIGDPR